MNYFDISTFKLMCILMAVFYIAIMFYLICYNIYEAEKLNKEEKAILANINNQEHSFCRVHFDDRYIVATCTRNAIRDYLEAGHFVEILSIKEYEAELLKMKIV